MNNGWIVAVCFVLVYYTEVRAVVLGVLNWLVKPDKLYDEDWRSQ